MIIPNIWKTNVPNHQPVLVIAFTMDYHGLLDFMRDTPW